MCLNFRFLILVSLNFKICGDDEYVLLYCYEYYNLYWNF